MIDQSRLKELLHYDPGTGLFTWRVSRGQAKQGDVAGTPNDGYVIIMLDYVAYFAHRLAWLYVYGVWPEDQIDHKNHNRADNWIANLRECTNLENQANRAPVSARGQNMQRVVGVGLHKSTGMWQVRVTRDTVRIHLGYFDDYFEAICVRFSADNR